MIGVDTDVERDAMAILEGSGSAGYAPDMTEDKALRFVAALGLARLVHAHLGTRHASGFVSGGWYHRAVDANVGQFLSQAEALLGNVRYRAAFGSATPEGLEPDRRAAILGGVRDVAPTTPVRMGATA